MSNGSDQKINQIFLFFWFFFCLIINRANCAFEHKVFGSCSIGAGSTVFVSRSSPFATLNNPARLSQDKDFRTDVFYRNFYDISDLDLICLDVHGRYRGIPVGVAITRFGNTAYQETEVHIATAYTFLNGHFALKAKWYNLEISRYGNAFAFAVDAAGIYQVSESLNLGFYLNNLNEPVIGTCREKIPGTFILGLEYMPAAAVRIRCNAVKASNEPFEYRIGAEYELVESVYLLMGFKDRSNTLSGGVVFEKGNMQFSCSFEYHPFLGGSKTVSAGYGI